MRFFAIALLLLTFNAQASEIKKSFDGQSARCSTGADEGSNAFRLKLLGEKKIKSTHVLSLEVTFLKCEKMGTSMKLISRKGDEILKQRTLLKDGNEGLIEHKVISFSVTAFTDSGKLLDKVQIEDLSQKQVRLDLIINENQLSANDDILINAIGTEAAKISTDADDNVSLRDFISGTYKLN